MGTGHPGASIDLGTISRAVLSVAIGVAHTVERSVGGTRTARGNAWEAVCADRDRALRHDEVRRLVAMLAATRRGGPPVS
jgi:hypothetical protein